MQQLTEILYVASTVYMLCMFIWALLSWLDQLSPSTAANSSVRAVRGFLDSVVLPYVRLWSFIPQPRGFPIDVQSLAAFVSIVVLNKLFASI